MALDAEIVNRTVSSYVDDVKKTMPIDKVFLFGSYSKGTATEHSDIDLCFFSHSFEKQSLTAIMRNLLRMTRKYKGIDIEPHAFPTSELENDNPLVKEILRTGREIQ